MKKLFKFFIFLLFLGSASIGGAYIFRNNIVSKLIENQASKAWGAKVEIEGVNFDLKNSKISFENLQITDKKNTMKNILETGRGTFDFNFKALLAKKIIIEEMSINEVNFNTQRKNDGKIIITINKEKDNKFINSIKEKLNNKLEEEKKNVPILSLNIDKDKLIDSLDLETPTLIEEKTKELNTKYKYWDNNLKEKNYEDRVKNLEKQFHNVENKVKNIKKLNIVEAQDLIKNVENLQKDGKIVYNDFKEDKLKFDEDIKFVSKIKPELNQAIKNDSDKIANKFNFSSQNIKNISNLILGEKLGKITQDIIEKTQNVNQINSINEVEIKNDKMPNLPSFWIKKLNVSLNKKDNIRLEGNIYDISSDMNKTLKPLKIELSGRGENREEIKLEFTIDKTHQTYLFLVNNIKFSAEKEIPEIKKALLDGNVNISIYENKFELKLNAELNSIEFSDNLRIVDDNLEKIYDDVKYSIRKIDLNMAILSSDDNDLSFKLDSNLDRIISNVLNQVLKSQSNKYKTETLKNFNNIIYTQSKPVYKIIDGDIANLSSIFNVNNKKLETNEKEVEKLRKKIEDYINAEINKMKEKGKEITQKEVKKIEKKLDKVEKEAEKILEDKGFKIDTKTKKKAKDAFDNLDNEIDKLF